MLPVSKELMEDFDSWVQLLRTINGVVCVHDQIWASGEAIHLFTESSGSEHVGCVCYFNGSWCYYGWPNDWSESELLRDMTP